MVDSCNIFCHESPDVVSTLPTVVKLVDKTKVMWYNRVQTKLLFHDYQFTLLFHIDGTIVKVPCVFINALVLIGLYSQLESVHNPQALWKIKLMQ